MGRHIGSHRGSKSNIQDGSFLDVEVSHDTEGDTRQAEYLSVSKGGDDALCIAYITVTWPDGGQRSWMGDVGKKCGSHWYPSHTIVDGYDSKPACMWIDGDQSYGILTEGFGVHITDFTPTQERVDAYNENPDLICKSKPRFHIYDDLTSDMYLPFFNPPLEYEPGTLLDIDTSKVFVDGDSTGSLPPKKRSTPIQRRNGTISSNNFMRNRLVSSRDPSQSARELCDSPTSFGPDFVSYAEGVFCDMLTKELWPLCSEQHRAACFDTNTKTMRPGMGIRGRDGSSGREVPEKSYDRTDEW
ncbi:hypothetical protein M501DRAFT_963863 [Patellaria atrata CBS 101060]|uniref:Uncharacterized protein n=1 Tax=Patellaria atrata CBS 101060 TaxID=1346257 RepID=A0A9P4S1Z2_9PEZI|nr:hypothetical protein M501DRAFT_963863 [Patellaria atrata CBS 101060]